MLLNYLKIAVRTIRRSASYTLINVSGLALGITCALLIFSLVHYHLGFDNFHNNSERIYRFVTDQHRDHISYSQTVPPAFGRAFRDDYTFGEKVARICTLGEELVTLDEGSQARKFKERVSFAESEFFDIFNFPLASGDRNNLLNEPNTALVSERIQKKYFGDDSVIGKTFRFNNAIDFTITGILKDIPDNTDLRSEIYFSYSTIKQYNEWYAADNAWDGLTSSIQTFVRLRPGITPGELNLFCPLMSKNTGRKIKTFTITSFNP